MKWFILAAGLPLVSLPGTAEAQDGLDIYAHHCSRDGAPMIVELWTIPKCPLCWNGERLTMSLLDTYLDDAMTRFIPKGENIYFYYGDKRRPPRSDIVAAMKRHGIVRRPECPRPAVVSIPQAGGGATAP